MLGSARKTPGSARAKVEYCGSGHEQEKSGLTTRKCLRWAPETVRERVRLQREVLSGRFPQSETVVGTAPPSSCNKRCSAGGGGGDLRLPLSSQTSICVAPPSSCVLLLLHPSTSLLHLLLPYLLLGIILEIRRKKRWSGSSRISSLFARGRGCVLGRGGRLVSEHGRRRLRR